MKVYALHRTATDLTAGRNDDVTMRSSHDRVAFRWYSNRDGSGLPMPLEFETPRPVAPHTDFPFTSSGYPVMSRRMGEVLAAHAVGAYLHAVRFVLPNGEGTDDDYVLLLMPATAGLFDREKSEWDPSTLFPDRVGFVSKLVLRWPPALGVALGDVKLDHYVTDGVRRELEALGVRGVGFDPIETS